MIFIRAASFLCAAVVVVAQSSSRNRRKLQDGCIQCITPGTRLAEVFFDAELELTTYYEPSRSCNSTEIEQVGAYMASKWDQFVADSSVLGPIDIELNSPLCPALSQTLHRSLVLRQRFGGDDRKVDAAVYTDDMPEFMQPQRHTPRRMGYGFLYRGGGPCRFCFPDDIDKRRRHLQQAGGVTAGDAPVTLYIETDVYPDEVGYKIKDAAGNTTFSDSYVYTRHQRTMFLNSGQFYFFEATDSYGDGWCCDYGNGNAKLYSGTPSQEGFLLFEFNGQFSYSNTIGFTVPFLTTPTNLTDDMLFEINVVPQLQEDLSRHITYYVQQYFNSMEDHCLFDTWPQVWVDLKAGLNATPTTSC